ncbi:hypothetical protein GWI33_009962 [Rhynchophorus ferrugineus]|uniref:Small acidic protein-like domain-containing protein n=1 Tax=Rhynchophorus ferrugineus TaxID=354439 RepID=A0A834J223_RHYFE|nr:hypothetical protein GWI33_009962 [Rhynchophorus ferrugineus]
MNSLVNYGSDDNSDESGEDQFPEMPGREKVAVSKNYRKTGSQEDNYEEVGMDMSEESSDSDKQMTNRRHLNDKNDCRDDRTGKKSRESPSNRSSSKSPKYKRDDEERRSSRSEDRYSKNDEKYRSKRDSREDDRSSKDDDRVRDRDRHREDRKDGRRDERYSRDDRHNRDRRDRDRKRSRSRDRRRSRSPRKSRSPRRSRSGSRDRGSSRGFRRDRMNRMNRMDKSGVEFKSDHYTVTQGNNGNTGGGSGDRFFMPGITGRFRDQIEKRKQLWQKAKDVDFVPSITTPGSSSIGAASAVAGSKAAKVYEATTFADDKTSNKFKRLMGIRDTGPSNLPTKSNDVLKKQEEMFSSMEAQYEVARTATHTMRGVGLGFGSFQR